VADGYHARTDGAREPFRPVQRARCRSRLSPRRPHHRSIDNGADPQNRMGVGVFGSSTTSRWNRSSNRDKLRDSASRAPKVIRVSDVRLRWLGHRLLLACTLDASAIRGGPDRRIRSGARRGVSREIRGKTDVSHRGNSDARSADRGR
jgi:hypothetical protein